MNVVDSNPFLHVLAGPTASGKTSLAIEWARHLDAEIVNADSQQVYRHFDIGTAKPSSAQLSEIPHHLISVVEPTEKFNAARFQTLADAAIQDIHQRGKRVVVVGGTGLYLRVLLHGVVNAPGPNADIRSKLEEEASVLGLEAMHRRLGEVDPSSAERIHLSDRVRILRALEIFEQSGQSASSFRQKHGFAEGRYRYHLTVLNPDRAQLYDRINARTREMFASGLVAEVESLVSRGFRNSAPMGAVGYVQALKVLDGLMSQEQAIEETAQKTRHYAKRQWTWFRKEPGAIWMSEPYCQKPSEHQ